MRFQQIQPAPDDLSRELTGERMMATSHYLAGKPATARHHAERMLTRLRHDLSPTSDLRLPLDHRVAMHGFVAPILWVLGLPRQARDAANEAIERALAADQTLSLCYTVAFVCPVLLWTGELARAKTVVDMLVDQAARHSLDYWSCWGACLQLATGPANEAVSCIELASNPLCTPLHLEVLATLRPDLASKEVLGRAERGLAGWCMPELLRIKAERIARSSPSEAHKAEAGLQRALAAAHSQGALSWELRAATSLGRLRRDRGHSQEARALLESVLHRFTEGFDTPDLVAARTLVKELAGGRSGTRLTSRADPALRKAMRAGRTACEPSHGPAC